MLFFRPISLVRDSNPARIANDNLQDTNLHLIAIFFSARPFFNWSKHSAPAGNSAVNTDIGILCTETFYSNEEKDLSAASVVVLKRVAGNRR